MWVDLSAKWSDGSGFFTAFRMTGGRDYCVYILKNETHRLYMESESPGLIGLSAGRSPVYRAPGGLTRTVMMSVSWYC